MLSNCYLWTFFFTLIGNEKMLVVNYISNDIVKSLLYLLGMLYGTVGHVKYALYSLNFFLS